jgi:hypothetical protein
VRPSSGPTGTLGTSDDPNFAPTLQFVEQALAGAPTLPGATLTDHAPTTALDEPSGILSNGNLIDRAAFWTAPGTLADAISYFVANPPTGTTLDGTGTAGNANTNTIDEQSLTFLFTAPSAGSEDAQLQIAVVPLGSGVAIRVDAAASWLPTKSAAEYIGLVTSVDVTVYRTALGAGGTPAAPTVRRTLTGAAAQRLAAAIDALPVDTPGVRHCPSGRGFSDELLFHAAGRTINATNTVGGCGGVSLTADGTTLPRLAGGIDSEIMAALGLPTNYGE